MAEGYEPINPETVALAREYWLANAPGTPGYMLWLAGLLDALDHAYAALGVEVDWRERPGTPTLEELTAPFDGQPSSGGGAIGPEAATNG